MRNEVLWIASGVVIALALLVSRLVLATLGRAPRLRSALANLVLTVATMTLCVTLTECYLRYRELNVVTAPAAAQSVPAPEAEPSRPVVIRTGRAEITLPAELATWMEERRSLVTMPDSFSERPVVVPCVKRAVRWQDVIHIYDENSFRRCDGPFPDARPDRFRVMVVGDSLTYGEGIEAKWSYPEQLQRLLGGDYRVEFINLGVGGYQSEDVLKVIGKWTPILRPNLIVYGVCLNDFLPAGVGQYYRDWSLPLPASWKATLKERTRVGRFVEDAYTNVLLRLGLSMDFIDDILKDFGNYQTRFGRDLVEMQSVARASGLPPIVGMVLNAYPESKGRTAQLVAAAEDWMRRADFDVISTARYNQTYDGQTFIVSRWDGHPNEQANAFFATAIADRLLGGDDLRAYIKAH